MSNIIFRMNENCYTSKISKGVLMTLVAKHFDDVNAKKNKFHYEMKIMRKNMMMN